MLKGPGTISSGSSISVSTSYTAGISATIKDLIFSAAAGASTSFSQSTSTSTTFSASFPVSSGMYGRVCFNPKRYEVTGNVEKWTYNDYSQPVYVSTIQTNVKAAVLHHDTGFYITKSIPYYDLENNSFTKISGDFTFENKKVRYQVGRINDLSQDFTEEFKEMKEYNDHVFLSYQVDDLT